MSRLINDTTLSRPTQTVRLDGSTQHWEPSPTSGTTRRARNPRTGGTGSAPGKQKEGTMPDHADPQLVIVKVCAAHQRREAVSLDYEEICGLLALIDQRNDAADRATQDVRHFRTRAEVASADAVLKIAAARDAAGALRRSLVQLVRSHGEMIATGGRSFRDRAGVEEALAAISGAAELLGPLDEVDIARLVDVHASILTEDRP